MFLAIDEKLACEGASLHESCNALAKDWHCRRPRVWSYPRAQNADQSSRGGLLSPIPSAHSAAAHMSRAHPTTKSVRLSGAVRFPRRHTLVDLPVNSHLNWVGTVLCVLTIHPYGRTVRYSDNYRVMIYYRKRGGRYLKNLRAVDIRLQLRQSKDGTLYTNKGNREFSVV